MFRADRKRTLLSSWAALVLIWGIGLGEGAAVAAPPQAGVPSPTTPVAALPSSQDRADAPKLVGAREMTLEQLVRHARDNAMAVRVGRARVNLGDAAIAGARPLLIDNPQLYAGLGARMNTLGTNFEFQGSLTQPVEVGGERGLRISRGKKYREMLDREVGQTQWEAYAAVHYSFDMALLARERAVTATRTLAFATRLLEVASRRSEAGEISALRVRLAEGEAAQARQALLNAELVYRLACRTLGEVSGWPADQLVAPAGVLETPTQLQNDKQLAKLLDEHPAVKARAAAVGFGEASLRSAKRDALPEPWFGVYFSHEREPGLTFPTRVALATITIPLPLWRRNQGPRAEAAAQLTIAQQELEALRYSLDINGRRAIDAVNIAAERVQTYASEVVPRFAENLSLLERAFELGEVDILEVFVARENFLRIQHQALEAYGAYFQAVYDLELWLGSPLQTLANP